MAPIGDVVTLKGFAAVFTAFAGWLVLAEPLTLRHLLALTVAMSAAVLITQPPMIFGEIGPQKDDSFAGHVCRYKL